MADYIFGEIDGINEGDTFINRKALAKAGIHGPIQGGIHGNSNDGACSIVLSGGYEDDEDHGNWIIYTGHGGNKDGKQISDQSWDAYGNKGLLISELHNLPVRVTRGHQHKSKYSPKTDYQYGGLYQVRRSFIGYGKSGFRVCRYELEKIDINNSLEEPEVGHPTNKNRRETKRVDTTISRIVRDTKLSKSIKELYNYECQVCSETISIRGVRYAEAAHIKPLGRPHNGEDEPGNILCLCPNHHVLFDKGGFTIDNSLKLIGIEGILSMNPNHQLLRNSLKYHRVKIYIG